MSDSPTAAPVRARDRHEEPGSRERDNVKAALGAFETDDLGVHLKAAQLIRRLVESEGIGRDEYLRLVGDFHENIECLESQEISHYATMFLGRHPETGEPLDATHRWAWSHRGQISWQAKLRLQALVKALPEQIEICEVGSFIGRGSTRAFIDAFRKLGKRGRIFCVDPWASETQFDFFRANIRQFGAEDIVTPVQSTSAAASLDFEDERFDLVYLDGLHDYRSVMSDISKWMPKVKPGGVMCGDDCEGSMNQCVPDQVMEDCDLDWQPELMVYNGDGTVHLGGHPGVIRAVDEFFRGRASIGLRGEHQWWVVKGGETS